MYELNTLIIKTLLLRVYSYHLCNCLIWQDDYSYALRFILLLPAAYMEVRYSYMRLICPYNS